MSFHPDDRPDPTEQPIRARVPDHVAGGCFSTGVIVMTAQTEFILDFVQNLGRPHQIVARVVMPHGVLPQLVDALGRNMQLYRSRWGELPHPTVLNQVVMQAPLPSANPGGAAPAIQPIKPAADPANPNPPGSNQASAGAAGGSNLPLQQQNLPPVPPQETSTGQPTPPNSSEGSVARQATAQEIYDDLKIRDELLSGNYANAVMIGHGPHEFNFDFITNFYPHSAVSVRVFMAAGQIPRLYDSLKGTWDQLRSRMQPPPPPNEPPPGWLG